VRDVRPFVEAYIDHRRGREAQILAQLAKGPASIKAMVPIMYADVDARLHPAACHSVLAHMLQLVKEGRVLCASDPCVESVYALA
jgi:hypothetical protein